MPNYYPIRKMQYGGAAADWESLLSPEEQEYLQMFGGERPASQPSMQRESPFAQAPRSRAEQLQMAIDMLGRGTFKPTPEDQQKMQALQQELDVLQRGEVLSGERPAFPQQPGRFGEWGRETVPQPPGTAPQQPGTAPQPPGTAPVTPPGTTRDPYAAAVTQSTTQMDPITQQLLFGLGGEGGFIPGAMRAAERTFYDESGQPIVIPEQVAGLSADQLEAMRMARGQAGIQDRYLRESEEAYKRGIGQLGEGLEGQRRRGEQALGATQAGVAEERRLREAGLEGLLSSIGEGRELARGATADLYGRLGETEDITRGAADAYGQRLGEVERIGGRVYDQFGRDITESVDVGRGATGRFGERLGESEALLRGTTGAYDPSMTGQFYDPYEQQVVQQTIRDIMEEGDIQDVGARAQDIARGGESAFGDRARLGAERRREALGKGLGKVIGGLRSQGFREAQQTGLGEFARQKAAQRAASSGLAGLFGQRFGSQQALAGQLGQAAGQRLQAGRGYGDLLSGTGRQQLGSQQALAGSLGQTGAQRYQAGTGLGQTLAGYGQAAGQAQAGAGQAALGAAGQLAGAYGQMGGLEGLIGQQQFGAQQGLSGMMGGLGTRAQQAGITDINMLQGLGGLQRGYQQQLLDAQRRNLLQAQQTPLAQYQSLLPFIQQVPGGQQSTSTQFLPPPSPLQAGLATGLGAFGAIGSFLNQPQYQSPYQSPYSTTP